MLKAVFIMNSDWSDLQFKCDLYENCPDDVKVFFPICGEDVKNSNIAFNKNEAISMLANGEENAFFSKIITEFDAMDCEFIIVVGGVLPHLDEQIARHLNAPFLLGPHSKHLANSFEFTILNDFKDIKTAESSCVTPLRFELNLLKKAIALQKSVVFPESDDKRVLEAANILLKSRAAKIILLGETERIHAHATNLGLNLNKATIINPQDNEYLSEFAQTLFELRKHKGMSKEQAHELIKDRTYFGTMLVQKGIAAAMVSGAGTTTAQTIRPALKFVKTKPGISTVSGSFIMCLKDRIWIFADCAICPNPTTDELAQIAVATAKTASDFGISPRVAMLSYSTGESGNGKDVEFVCEALNKARELAPELAIDGPMQFDAAVNSDVAKKKMPNSKVAGVANVFIFPDLNCGNICYKAVQRSANAIAIGPILQGLNKPINDLSRGCLVKDIVNTTLISILQGE